MNTNSFRFLVSFIVAALLYSGSALYAEIAPVSKESKEATIDNNNDSLKKEAFEIIEFIQTRAHEIFISLSAKNMQDGERVWLHKIAAEFEAVEQMKQDLLHDRNSAEKMILNLASLSSFLGSWAVMDDHADALEEFLSLGVFTDPVMCPYLQPVMDTAIREGHKEMIDILSKYEVPPTDYFLLDAVTKRDAKLTSTLLSHGASKYAHVMLGPDIDLKDKPGIEALISTFASIDKLMEKSKDDLDALLREDQAIDEYLYKDGYRSFRGPWSPVLIAAAGKDLETLKVLMENGLKPFKHEKVLMKKIADQLLNVTEKRKMRNFRNWWNFSASVVSLGITIGTYYYGPPSVSFPQALAIFAGGNIVGGLSSYFVEHLWVDRDSANKRQRLSWKERKVYDQLIALDHDIATSIAAVAN